MSFAFLFQNFFLHRESSEGGQQGGSIPSENTNMGLDDLLGAQEFDDEDDDLTAISGVLTSEDGSAPDRSAGGSATLGQLLSLYAMGSLSVTDIENIGAIFMAARWGEHNVKDASIHNFFQQMQEVWLRPAFETLGKTFPFFSSR